MLGKTNINTLSEGAIVTEIEDFSWVQMQSGTYENFYKVISENGYLAAITQNGTVVYSTDGEVWQSHQMEYTDCKLNDIAWDGSRFILVGSYTDTSQDTSGLILTTTDFETYEKINIPEDDSKKTYEYFAMIPLNGEYILLSYGYGKYLNSTGEGIFLGTTDLYETLEKEYWVTGKDRNGQIFLRTAYNNNGFIIYRYFGGHTNQNISNGVTLYTNGKMTSIFSESLNGSIIPNISVFECKNTLYYMIATDNKSKLVKVSNYGEAFTMSEGQNFAFVDGVYYAGCEIFINNTSILVVKPGENITDKTVDDLKEIAPEFTLNCIAKAFDNLYIFGNRGVILKSSAETGNEGAIAVQAISAKKALAEAKAYTDEQIALLDARIAALEALQS